MSEEQSILTGELTARETGNSGTDSEALQTQKKPSDDPVDQIAELLAEGIPDEETSDSDPVPEQQAAPGEHEGESGGGEEAPEEAPQEEVKLTTLKDAAEALGKEASALYDVKIPMGDGESQTLGELKDTVLKQREWTSESVRREEELTERELRTARDQQELSYLSAEIAHKMDPEQVKQARARRETELRQEQLTLAEASPKFKDPAQFDLWRNEAVTFLSRYGFKPQDMMITDHRMVLMLDDLMETKKRIKNLANVRPRRKEPPKVKRTGLTKGTDKRTPANSRDDHLDQVANLLKGVL